MTLELSSDICPHEAGLHEQANANETENNGDQSGCVLAKEHRAIHQRGEEQRTRPLKVNSSEQLVVSFSLLVLKGRFPVHRLYGTGGHLLSMILANLTLAEHFAVVSSEGPVSALLKLSPQ
ncbi:hypothetical protein SKAU_G00048250 [Synaphobranchus kaupii]|uniref:Uncharacterized protein n=1 Tax=Synaphobranchus kaupii TaxID=118154 RepID=A0A9Q1G2M5_SYNKA|nr:hypothetical protein SKAU_G00048250 [Synaphobranchus kaupii]